MITLPGEVNTEKDKISNSPILMIEFPNIPFYIATKQYTLSGTTYQNLVKQQPKVTIRDSVPLFLGGLSSQSGVTISILDWKNTLLPNIFSGAPDKTGEEVIVRLKYDTQYTDISNSVVLFEGILGEYSIRRNVAVFKLKSGMPTLSTKIPNQKAGESYKPLQYGDFSWNDDPLWWGDETRHFAICPMTSYNEDTGEVRYWIAKHQMVNMPSGTQIGGTALAIQNTYAFIVREGYYINMKFTNAPTVTNTSSGAYIDAQIHDSNNNALTECELFIPPKKVSGGGLDNGNAIDGKSSTYTTLAQLYDITYSRYGLGESDLELDDHPSTTTAAFIYAGFVETGAQFEVILSDGTNTVTYTSLAANSWNSLAFPSDPTDIRDLENYTIRLRDLNDTVVHIHGILLRVRLKPVQSTDDFLYIRCQGRAYSGTWGGRKTSGTLITNVADAIESILRDELGYTDSDIDTTSFDELQNWLSTNNVECAFSLYEPQKAKNIIREVGESHNFLIIWSDQKWKLVAPYPALAKFEISGTTTPNEKDIYTDSNTISGDSYSNHPIKLKSFSLKRTPERERFNKVEMKYVQYDGGFREIYTSGSGERVKTIENRFIRNRSSVSTIMGQINQLWRKQRFITQFDTFWNAIGMQPGDIINIRHTMLDDSILSYTVNTQPWVIVNIMKKWKPHTINITAVELP